MSERRRGTAPFRYNKPAREIYDSDLVRLAGFQGFTEALKWLKSAGVALDSGAWVCGRRAALAGQKATLKWLRSQGYKFNTRTCFWAARGGRLELLQWLAAEGCAWNENECRSTAQRNGHILIVRWLDERNMWLEREGVVVRRV